MPAKPEEVSRQLFRTALTLEYHALTVLAIIIPIYFVGIIVLCGCLLMIIWPNTEQGQFALERNNLTYGGTAMFHAVSAFNNAGFSTFQANLMEVRDVWVGLLVVDFLVLAGNTAYPVFLRGFIKILYHCTREPEHRQTLHFLLQNPRRVYTHLFPTTATNWLIFAVTGFTLFEFLTTIGFDWDTDLFLNTSTGNKISQAFSQALSTRHAGFNVFDLSLYTPAGSVCAIGLMYAAAVPVSQAVLASTEGPSLIRESTRDTISIRKSLVSVVTNHQIGLFIAYIALAFFERHHLEDEPDAYNLYKIMFELISAYGNVGVSLGYPGAAFSFSGKFAPVSKFILVLVMLMGRNRSLPPAINRDIRLDTADAGSVDEADHLVIEVQASRSSSSESRNVEPDSLSSHTLSSTIVESDSETEAEADSSRQEEE